MFATNRRIEPTLASARRHRPADPAQLVLVACGYSRDSVACITVTIGLLNSRAIIEMSCRQRCFWTSVRALPTRGTIKAP